MYKLKSGFASLIGVSVEVFNSPGFVFEIVEQRSKIAWGENWFQPLWAVSLLDTTVCTVAPEYAQLAKAVFDDWQDQCLVSAHLQIGLRDRFQAEGWQGLEILYYPQQNPPYVGTVYSVSKLDSENPEYLNYAREFSGGTFVICDSDHHILSWAGVKDHREIQEIAVGTEAEHRKKGMGKAVVARAVKEILARGSVPVYIPDEVSNEGSYALARSVGFEKIGEMLLWEIQR